VNEALRQAIDALYAAFASVRRPKAIAGCPCCIEDKEIAALLATPLRELSPDQLSSYASSVFLTVGDEQDFRYFVPRILEISATDSGWWPDPEVVARALAEARWCEWPTVQREAVGRVWDEKFTELVELAEGSELDSWLWGLARIGLDLSPFLTRLSLRPAAVLALYGWHANEIVEHRLANGFWDEAPKGRQDVIAWFHSPEMSRLVLDGYGVDLNVPRST
jgi:hypothetical protein